MTKRSVFPNIIDFAENARLILPRGQGSALRLFLHDLSSESWRFDFQSEARQNWPLQPTDGNTGKYPPAVIINQANDQSLFTGGRVHLVTLTSVESGASILQASGVEIILKHLA